MQCILVDDKLITKRKKGRLLSMQTQEYVHVARPEISDAVLAQQTLAGDQRAFEVLVHRYSTPLFTFICRYLDDYDQAWDVLQQVFLRFYTFLPRLSSREPYKAWLFQVARNCCVDELRRRRRHAIHFSQLESTNDEYETSQFDRWCSKPVPLVRCLHCRRTSHLSMRRRTCLRL